MKSQRTKFIREKLAKEYNITQEEVEVIMTAIFDYQSSIIMKGIVDTKEGVFPTLRVPNFGKFYVPEYIKDKYKK